jgi:hypothetical protein
LGLNLRMRVVVQQAEFLLGGAVRMSGSKLSYSATGQEAELKSARRQYRLETSRNAKLFRFGCELTVNTHTYKLNPNYKNKLKYE